MKQLLILALFTLVCGTAAFAQPEATKKKPTDDDKNAAIPAETFLKRGAPIGASPKVSLNKVLKDPAKYSGKPVLIEGVVVRSCKTEGCWAEVAETADSKSVRVKMKDHAFFIPLQSAGARARIEGTVLIKTISKAEVDHMIEEDGATFEKRNPDGTVTEVSLEANGIELTRRAKN